MRIILMRHGRPLIGTTERLSAAEFGRWLRAYDQADIDPGHPPPETARALAASVGAVVCSSLTRSLGSARALGRDATLCDPLFREVEMPWAGWPLPRLSPKGWCVAFRLAWLAGFSPRVEDFAAARERARACAARLEQLAAAHGSVLLVGHGSLNWAIARSLRAAGWAGLAAPRRHWQAAAYIKRRP